MTALYCILCTGCKSELSSEVRENPAEPGGMSSSHYIGMTAGSLHNRWKAHREGHQREQHDNALFVHDKEHHGGEKQVYIARLVSREQSLLTLTIREALLQEKQKKQFSMNNRIEMGRAGGLVRIHTTRAGVT